MPSVRTLLTERSWRHVLKRLWVSPARTSDDRGDEPPDGTGRTRSDRQDLSPAVRLPDPTTSHDPPPASHDYQPTNHRQRPKRHMTTNQPITDNVPSVTWLPTNQSQTTSQASHDYQPTNHRQRPKRHMTTNQPITDNVSRHTSSTCVQWSIKKKYNFMLRELVQLRLWMTYCWKMTLSTF